MPSNRTQQALARLADLNRGALLAERDDLRGDVGLGADVDVLGAPAGLLGAGGGGGGAGEQGDGRGRADRDHRTDDGGGAAGSVEQRLGGLHDQIFLRGKRAFARSNERFRYRFATERNITGWADGTRVCRPTCDVPCSQSD